MSDTRDPHFHDCGWWIGGDCNCTARTDYSLSASPDFDFDHYCCGSNYCDDPACISNQPDHPEYFRHPEVL